jgi:hypothetical protein
MPLPFLPQYKLDLENHHPALPAFTPSPPHLLSFFPFTVLCPAHTGNQLSLLRSSSGPLWKALAEDLIPGIRVWGKIVCVQVRAI